MARGPKRTEKPEDAIWRGDLPKHPEHRFVKSGDVALTRALLKRGAIRVCAKRGGRVQQVGVAALPADIAAAQAEVASTADARAVARERSRVARAADEAQYRAEFADAVRRLYPSVPEGDVDAIVSRALEVSSGRVGRTAAAKALADEPVRLAVLAHIRHVHTDYDARLRRAGLGQRFGRAGKDERQKARKAVKARIQEVARDWSKPASPGAPAPAPLPAPASPAPTPAPARTPAPAAVPPRSPAWAPAPARTAAPTPAPARTAAPTPAPARTAAPTPAPPRSPASTAEPARTPVAAPALARTSAAPSEAAARARLAPPSKPRSEQRFLWERPLG